MGHGSAALSASTSITASCVSFFWSICTKIMVGNESNATVDIDMKLHLELQKWSCQIIRRLVAQPTSLHPNEAAPRSRVALFS